VRKLAFIPVLVACLGGPETAQAAPVNHCGSWGDHGDGSLRWDDSTVYGAGIFNVRSIRVGCPKARHMARFGVRPSRCNDDFTYCEIGSFTCRSKQQYEYARFRCKNPKGRVVRWETGA
jgi:hypothetical protein